ncbi:MULTISPECIES: hypothetical protein [unclassified Streptomyces]|uniref:hypothetical protein n=1 Tax=unclassified Streptomyces TaxID=2593676 RepID=UPI0033DE9A55
MKVFWVLITLLLTALALGGFINAVKDVDKAGRLGDLALSAALALAARGSWRRVGA